MSNIKVRYRMDRMGNVTIQPIRHDIKQAIIKYLSDFKSPIYIREVGTFIQEASYEQLKDEGLKQNEIDDLHRGWDVIKIVDSYYFLSKIGYDAHRAITVTGRDVEVR